MITRVRTRSAAGAAVVTLLSLAVLSPTPASADQSVTTVASGLDNPRGLAFAPDGSLYVAESGIGGTAPCFTGETAELVCYGATGAITRITRDNQRRVVTGLPSVADPGGANAIGPSDVAFVGDTPVFTVGLAVQEALRDTFPTSGQNAGWLLKSAGGQAVRVADIAGYATQTDPDAGNPNSVTITSAGAIIADSAGNSLVGVARDGTASTIATFPTQLVDAPSDLGLPPGTQIPASAVPTAAVVGPDGAYYVGQLTGYPFPVGKANVFRVVPGSAPTVVASGFTNIIDLAFDRRGSLYVLELAHNGLLSGDLTGALIKVKGDGSRETVTTDLTGPGGLVIKDGAAYVSDCGVCAGAGRVLRIPLS
ncbi:MAG TPA: ScyD/ScyE family protein [Actinokineospora sp.]|nr:ScyD/ScyE family protein [Actinokineospora sp.]